MQKLFLIRKKYKLKINYLDLNSKENNNYDKYLTYYPIIASDAKEQKKYSEEELLITEPFEDSLNKIKLKYISQKNQNIIANRIEKFEFEWEDTDIIIDVDYYPSNSKLLTKELEEKNKFIFYFGINEKKRFILKFNFSKNYDTINEIIYIVDYKGKIDIPFSLPNSYDNDIILVDPIFPKLKIGKEITLKFKSSVIKEIIITNGEWINFKKNADGIFEVKITPEVNEIFVLKKKENSDNGDTSMTFKVEKK